MAKINFGPLFFDIRGKFGNYVFKKHPYSDQVVLEPKALYSQDPAKRAALNRSQKCFKAADLFWTSNTIAWRKMWCDAVKKKAMTGYLLWMKEALPLLNEGSYAPDVPSISGGYTSYKAKPGWSLSSPCAPPSPPGVWIKYINAWKTEKTTWGFKFTMKVDFNDSFEYKEWHGTQFFACALSWIPAVTQCDPVMIRAFRIYWDMVNKTWRGFPSIAGKPPFIWENLYSSNDYILVGCAWWTLGPSKDQRGGFSWVRPWFYKNPMGCTYYTDP
ncbi:hypothetical protein ES703_107809 [subsurface metagenome]